MYLQPTEKHWACDIEADGLMPTATRVWCATAINVVTKEKREFTTGESFKEWFDEVRPILVGHNFLSYDAVMLNRFWNAGITVSRIVDTFVLSQLYNPNNSRPKGMVGKKGPHSLEAWGIRLRYPKGEFDDFSAYSEKMLRYCMRDSVLTALLFIRLTERMRSVHFSERGAELEHLAWNIIQNKQARNGFPLNKKNAELLYAKLRDREEELKNEIYKLWPPELLLVKSFGPACRKDGTPTANYTRHVEQYPKLVIRPDGRYDAYDWVSFNLGSPGQRIEKLLGLGWTPTSFTKKTKKGGGGNPQIDEDSLLAYAELSGRKELLALAKWVVINSRANMINTWLNAYNEETKSVHGKLFLAGTLRYKHSDPNTANIPAVRLKKDDKGDEHILYGEDGGYAYESRDLWWCGDPDKYSLVGIDGTGIQNRCLIHGLIKTVGEELVAPYKELSLHGDIHKRNIEVLGLTNKAAAKKAFYTILMGGGGALIAADQAQFGTKLTAKEGTALRQGIIDGIPGFGELRKTLEAELDKTGRIKLCDDTPILVSSPHMVIPYLLQGDESRLMKQALIYVDEEVRRRKLSKYVFKVADIHDEWQWRVANEVTDEFVSLALPCFPRAGESFGYNIQIDGDAKVGKTWSETH